MAEETAKTEGQTAEGASQGEQNSNKKKKINKLSLDEINKKIEEIGKSNQLQSRYYQHLLGRKNELQSPE